MKDINSIPDSCNSLLNSFYSSCESFTSSFYTTLDHTQLIQRNDLKSRSTPKNLARNQPEEILLKTRPNQEFIDRSAITPEKFAATSAIDTNSGIYDRHRALHHKILAQRDRHKSAQIITIDTRQNENVAIGRTKAENPRCSAQKKGNLRRHETLTDRSLQAFLPVLSMREWARSGIRYNLKKAAQVGTRSTQLTGYQARSFWQWIEPPPDIPIRIPQGAASLQEGGAL